MANNINRVWELMGINAANGTGTYKNRMGLGNAITRDNGIPLDLSSLHATYNDAVVYAATNAIAYVDQVIAAEGIVYIITAESQGKVTIGNYKDSITGKIIESDEKEYDVYLKPVGTIPGFDEAADESLPRVHIGDDGKRTLTWVPISAIINDTNTKTEVEVAEGESRISVDEAYDSTTDKYTYSISVNVADLADSEQVAEDIAAAKEDVEGQIASAVETLEGKISDEEAARNAAIGSASVPAVGTEGEDDYVPAKAATGLHAVIEAADAALETKIAQALQDAKDYADGQDGEISETIEALDGRVETAEGKIEDLEDVVGNAGSGLVKELADLATALADETERAEEAEAKILTDAKTYTNEEIAGLTVAIEQKEGVEYIIVKNKAGTEVASVNASKFVQDSFLNDVSYDPTTRKVSFTWSMGDGSTKTDEIEIGDLVDTYTAGEGLTLNDNKFAVNTEVIATKSDIEDVNEELATKRTEAQVDDQIDAKLVAVNAEIAKKADAETTNAAIALKANAADVASTVEGINTELAKKAVKTDVETALSGKVDKESYTADKQTFNATYATKTELSDAVEDFGEAIGTLTENVYSKTDADAKFDTITNVSSTYATKAALEVTDKNVADNAKAIEDLDDRVDSVIADNITITSISVNGTTQTIDSNKNVNISVPVISTVKVSDLKDGGEVLQDIADLQEAVEGNTGDITTINNRLNAEASGLVALSTRLSTLETEVKIEGESRIDALEGIVGDTNSGLVKVVAEHTANITNLGAKDAELAGLIAGNTAKFNDYRTIADSYSKSEVDNAIEGAVDAIDFTPYAVKTEVAKTVESLTGEINKKADSEATTQALNLKANASDVYTKTEADAEFMTQDEVDARINALIAAADPEDGKTIENIANLVKYVDENAGEIAELITAVGDNADNIAANTEAINANADAIEELQDALETSIAATTVHSSTEITVANRTGTNETGVALAIKEVNVNKLVQTEGEFLILNGGNTLGTW